MLPASQRRPAGDGPGGLPPVQLVDGAPAGHPSRVDARAAIVVDRTTGRVLYQKGAHRRLPIASLTKLMTALVGMDRKLDAPFRVTPAMTGVPGYTIGLQRRRSRDRATDARRVADRVGQRRRKRAGGPSGRLGRRVRAAHERPCARPGAPRHALLQPLRHLRRGQPVVGLGRGDALAARPRAAPAAADGRRQGLLRRADLVVRQPQHAALGLSWRHRNQDGPDDRGRQLHRRSRAPRRALRRRGPAARPTGTSSRPPAACSTGASGTTAEDRDDRPDAPRPAHRPSRRGRPRRRRRGPCPRRRSQRGGRAAAGAPRRGRDGRRRRVGRGARVRARPRAARAPSDARVRAARKPRRPRRRCAPTSARPACTASPSASAASGSSRSTAPGPASTTARCRPTGSPGSRPSWPSTSTRRRSSRCTIPRFSPASRRST